MSRLPATAVGRARSTKGSEFAESEPLDAERLFLLADAHLGERTEAQIDVSVLENRCPAAEIRRQAEVEVLEDGALDDRAHPAKQKRIDALNGVFAQEEATVGLHEPAESQLEAVVGRSQLEPTLSRARDRCRLHHLRLLLPFELESSLENAELLIELVQRLRRRQSLERRRFGRPSTRGGFRLERTQLVSQHFQPRPQRGHGGGIRDLPLG